MPQNSFCPKSPAKNQPLSWQQWSLSRSALAYALRPVAWLYELLWRVAARRGAKRAQRNPPLPVPVLVIGNVIAGGAGKTPLVLALIDALSVRGILVGVVSRGYGRQHSNIQTVNAQSSARDVGDEPLLIFQQTREVSSSNENAITSKSTSPPTPFRCPPTIVVGADRYAAAQHLLQQAPSTQLIISDDGLQHLSLARQAEWIVFDERGIGNGWLLPAGPLRQPWPMQNLSRLKAPANLPWRVIFTPPNPAPGILQANTAHSILVRQLADHATNALGQQLSMVDCKTIATASGWHAMAGIAKPQAFFEMLQQIGLTPATTQGLADHASLDALIDALPTHGKCLITEKDAVKLWPWLRQHAPERVNDVWSIGLCLALPTRWVDELCQRLHLDSDNF